MAEVNDNDNNGNNNNDNDNDENIAKKLKMEEQAEKDDANKTAPVFVFVVGEEFFGDGYVNHEMLTTEEERLLLYMSCSAKGQKVMVAASNLFLEMVGGSAVDEVQSYKKELEAHYCVITDDFILALAKRSKFWKPATMNDSNAIMLQVSGCPTTAPRPRVFLTMGWH